MIKVKDVDMELKNETTSDIRVIYIPEYVMKSLEVNGITLPDLENRVREDNWQDELYYKKSLDHKEDLFKDIAHIDRRDFVISNVEIPSSLHVLSESYGETTLALARNSKFKHNEDNDVKHLYNILLDYNIDHADSYELRIGEKTVFIILKYGFTNFIVTNDKKAKFVFYKTLLDFMFQHYDYRSVVNTTYFKNFLFY